MNVTPTRQSSSVSAARTSSPDRSTISTNRLLATPTRSNDRLNYGYVSSRTSNAPNVLQKKKSFFGIQHNVDRTNGMNPPGSIIARTTDRLRDVRNGEGDDHGTRGKKQVDSIEHILPPLPLLPSHIPRSMPRGVDVFDSGSFGQRQDLPVASLAISSGENRSKASSTSTPFSRSSHPSSPTYLSSLLSASPTPRRSNSSSTYSPLAAFLGSPQPTSPISPFVVEQSRRTSPLVYDRKNISIKPRSSIDSNSTQMPLIKSPSPYILTTPDILPPVPACSLDFDSAAPSDESSIHTSPSRSFTSDSTLSLPTSSESSLPSSITTYESKLDSLDFAAVPPILSTGQGLCIDTLAREPINIPVPRRQRVVPLSQFELVISRFKTTIFVSLLRSLRLSDIKALRKTSLSIKRLVECDGKELVLQRYLGHYGYRSYAPVVFRGRNLGQHMTETRSSTISNSSPVDETSSSAQPVDTLLSLCIDDIFDLYHSFTTNEFAQSHQSQRPLHDDSITMLRDSTRAWNKVALRLREQEAWAQNRLLVEGKYYGRADLKDTVYREGRAVMLKVWVPCITSRWMKDEDIIECERELSAAGIWEHVRRGDIIWNTAIPEFANEGKLISDGKYLRDLQYEYDCIGHLPAWLDSLGNPPDYFYRKISSTGEPVAYLCLHAFVKQIRENIGLCTDQVDVSSPQGGYRVKRFVYRTWLRVLPATIVSCSGAIETVHDDWVGTICIECDGTKEHADFLLATCARQVPSPFKILREKSRPGEIWIKPLMKTDRHR